MMSRLLNDVATFFLCKMMSRQLLIWQLMSRPLNDVATLISLQADVATASDSMLTSRALLDVATLYIQFLEDLMSRLLFGVTTLHVFCYAFNFVATLCGSSSLSMRRYNRSFLPRVHHLLQHHLASHLILSQPSFCSWYCNILFLSNFLLHSSLVSYSTFLHINQFILDKNQSEKWTENG